MPLAVKGQRFGGRKKGSRNKTTLLAKEAIAAAADKLGGVKRLVAWAKEDPQNERVFWGTIYTKLLPLQVAGDPNNPLQVVSRIERVFIEQAIDGPDAADTDAEGVPTAH